MMITGEQKLPKQTAIHEKWVINALPGKASTNLSTDNVYKEALRHAELLRCEDMQHADPAHKCLILWKRVRTGAGVIGCAKAQDELLQNIDEFQS
ncbi:MAG: hypothetical protein ACRETA_01380 [Gammaproteobacteria bacterium]